MAHALEKRKDQMWGVGLFVLLGACVVLFFCEPTRFGFYPQCALYRWTGLSCPGCGGLRATHQLLHGHLFAAFKLNPLFILLLPLFAWMGIREIVRLMKGKVYPSPFQNVLFGWALGAVAILFGIVRNLPFSCFAWMNP